MRSVIKKCSMVESPVKIESVGKRVKATEW